MPQFSRPSIGGMRPDDPGYSRDPALEALRGLHRPAGADLSPLDRSCDPNPDRHIHFAPHPEDGTPDVEGLAAAPRDPCRPRV